jgi:NAD(P)-dependent dehydrogenase (short-subunit alcohol dehydrogenase family)
MGDRFDKVVIITGGSTGIGEGCVRVFVGAGARVVTCARGKEVGETLAAELTAKGPGACRFEQCDVSQPEQIRHLVEKTVEMYGRLDCLVNNAGFHPDHKPIDEFSVQDFEDLLRLNLVSYFAACKYALPYLRKTEGCIVNMGSLVGTIGQEWATTYVATKGAISSLTKALAIDEARYGVRVNAVLPGCVYTPGAKRYIQSSDNPQAFEEYVKSWQWTERMGTVEEVGYACLFLASDRAGFITGVELNLSGGAELGYGPKQRNPNTHLGKMHE